MFSHMSGIIKQFTEQFFHYYFVVLFGCGLVLRGISDDSFIEIL